MQPSQLQKDKLNLIEKIIQTNDQEVIDYISSVFTDKINEYELTEEQKIILEEATEKYYSGEEPSFSWEEIKANARKSYSEKKS